MLEPAQNLLEPAQSLFRICRNLLEPGGWCSGTCWILLRTCSNLCRTCWSLLKTCRNLLEPSRSCSAGPGWNLLRTCRNLHGTYAKSAGTCWNLVAGAGYTRPCSCRNIVETARRPTHPAMSCKCLCSEPIAGVVQTGVVAFGTYWNLFGTYQICVPGASQTPFPRNSSFSEPVGTLPEPTYFEGSLLPNSHFPNRPCSNIYY